VWNDPATIRHTLPPFHFPTDAAVSRDGMIYVSDGYGNARVHVFSPAGRLLFSWGEPGNGPGQFRTVHDVCIDQQGRVCVADRENSRIQIFSTEGEFLQEWRDVWRPNMMATDAEGHAYVTELGPTFTGATQQRASLSRITVRDDRGQILSEWGAADPEGADLYFAPHGIAIDSRGNVYVGEVAATFSHGMDPGRRSPLHKYARL
jgi:DNA-binding beta-propeller fold protein YncE